MTKRMKPVRVREFAYVFLDTHDGTPMRDSYKIGTPLTLFQRPVGIDIDHRFWHRVEIRSAPLRAQAKRRKAVRK